MIAFEGFSQMLLNFLQIPAGSSIRQNYSGNGKTNSAIDNDLLQVVENNEYIQAAIDITRDDICLGKSPLYYECSDDIDDDTIKKVEDKLLPAFNKVIKWACRDLQVKGYSVFFGRTTETGKYFLVPVLNQVEFFLDQEMELKVFLEGNQEALTDAIVFVNYDKDSLQEIEDSEKNNLMFSVSPIPMQLKNIAKTAAEVASTEKSIQRYRRLLSRIIRLINVDVGLSQGDKNSSVVDKVASVINADSDTIESLSTFQMYNDEIPVLPNRRGIGKPEYEEHIPSADIKDLADLDHAMSKLNLQLRFPKSYGDFSNALSETAASTIRGDIRYNRMLSSIRTLLEDTINEYLSSNKLLKKFEVKFKLSELPTPENADVLETLNQFGDFVSDVWDMISGSESKDEANAKIQALQALLSGAAKLPYVQDFLDVIKNFIDTKWQEGEDSAEPDFEDNDSGESFESESSEDSSKSASDVNSDDLSGLGEPE